MPNKPKKEIKGVKNNSEKLTSKIHNWYLQGEKVKNAIHETNKKSDAKSEIQGIKISD